MRTSLCVAMTKNTTWYSADCAFIHFFKCVVHGCVSTSRGTKAVSHRRSVETPHRPTVWSFIQDHSLFTNTNSIHTRICECIYLNAASSVEKSCSCFRVRDALRMDPARARTEFYSFHAARSIADNAEKTLGCRRSFCYAKQQKPCRKSSPVVALSIQYTFVAS